MGQNGGICLVISQLGKQCTVIFDCGSGWGLGKRSMRPSVREVRKAAGREEEPSLIIIDSQSVKLGQKGGMPLALMGTKR